MKLFLYTDVHWSETSSIIRSRGKVFSTRLENLIASVNWAEQQAALHGCDAVVCLGDFFDKSTLSAEEITALTQLQWSNMPHYFLVGNHDANVNDLSYASTFVFDKPNFTVVSQPMLLEPPVSILEDPCCIYLIPYILESDRKPLREYLDMLTPSYSSARASRIVLSHNDLSGLQYGQFLSTQGFSVSEILQQSDLFINGHLHNAGFVDDSEKILNLGNLSGQNFSEDATIYRHYGAILNTKDLSLEFLENPYAFKFYKLQISSMDQLTALRTIEGPAAVSVQCVAECLPEVKQYLQGRPEVVAARTSLLIESSASTVVEISELARTDYLQQFSEYVLTHLDNTEALQKELQLVLTGGN